MNGELTVSTADVSQHVRRLVAVTALVAVVISLTACSTLQGSSENTWTASFFKDPDSVWNAIELSLLELDYEVADQNRPDGVIRAESSPAEDGTVIALAIDQVMRTEDQVNVYVKPSFGGDRGSTDPDLLKAAADEFVRVLKGKLNA
jgi:uncharacterized lipoprotein